jgi:hypothetical protein
MQTYAPKKLQGLGLGLVSQFFGYLDLGWGKMII